VPGVGSADGPLGPGPGRLAGRSSDGPGLGYGVGCTGGPRRERVEVGSLGVQARAVGGRDGQRACGHARRIGVEWRAAGEGGRRRSVSAGEPRLSGWTPVDRLIRLTGGGGGPGAQPLRRETGSMGGLVWAPSRVGTSAVPVGSASGVQGRGGGRPGACRPEAFDPGGSKGVVPGEVRTSAGVSAARRLTARSDARSVPGPGSGRGAGCSGPRAEEGGGSGPTVGRAQADGGQGGAGWGGTGSLRQTVAGDGGRPGNGRAGQGCMAGKAGGV